jgi:amino acid permease
LLSTIATAYVAHYNAPKFWTELKQRSMSRYNLVVYSAFGFAAIMYFIVMVIGFNTFGGNASGFILNNYSARDMLATLGRLAIGGGILFGYPLTFSALRDGCFDLLR